MVAANASSAYEAAIEPVEPWEGQERQRAHDQDARGLTRKGSTGLPADPDGRDGCRERDEHECVVHVETDRVHGPGREHVQHVSGRVW